MATIKQIDGRTIHQIQSGQVIVDLCSVVKELLENSIDAGATTIEVRFRNQGLDLIEVQDNGTGISQDNYPSVALKHHTSKLSSYSDIAALQTFGFRGEALASLCALSVLSVTTCQASEVPKGNRLSFEPSGKLKGTTIVAAQKGTTVSVENLFHNLPVRRRELERNIKREWHKLIALLNQYACIQTNLKFSVSQQPTKGKRIHLFSTRGNPSTRENIMNIFGAKTMTVLVPLDLKLEMQPSTINKGLQIDTENATRASRGVHVVGHVSRPAHGDGRQTPDRQMFFVNGRPCGLPQFAKVFNEVYKSYNASQNPFILADIQLDTDLYDVNVSPDKRSILLHDQNNLLDTLRNSLISLFDSQEYSVPAAQLLKPRQPDTIQSKSTVMNLSSTPCSPSSNNDQDQYPGSEDEEAAAESPIKISLGRAKRIGGARSLSKDTSGQNLISRWVEKQPTGQSDPNCKPLPPTSELSTTKAADSKAGLSKNKPAIKQMESSPTTSESEDDDKPLPVRDFNKRLAEFGSTCTKNVMKPAVASSSSSGESLEGEDDDDEPHIHAVQPRPRRHVSCHAETQPQGSHKGIIPEVATIVIGDDTINNAADLSEDPISETESPIIETSTTKDKPRPSFGNRLTQLFSAGDREQGPDESDEMMSSDKKMTVEDTDEEGESEPSRSTTKTDGVNSKPRPSFMKTDEYLSSSIPHSNEDIDDKNVTQDTTTNTQTPDDIAGPDFVDQRGQSLKSGGRKKDATLLTVQYIRLDESTLRSQITNWIKNSPDITSRASDESGSIDLNAVDAEEKLSLTISKGDFSRMRIAGQFNLGFIIAIRPAKNKSENEPEPDDDDELFIIDQHATDEKYNFERLQAITVVQSQRLVHPKRLELTALEEEIVMENMEAIEANGFKVDIDTTGEEPVGSRCQVSALPLSRETTFTLKDLEELISLLGDESSESKHIPRPSKVRKMFAMRACRSSIMIGKPLTQGQMETLVKHMGELDKPWNCPHGRPTMRHLCKLQPWDSKGWKGDQYEPNASWRRFAHGE